MFSLYQVFGRFLVVFLSVTQALAKSLVPSCVEEVMMQTGRCILQKVVERCYFAVRRSMGEDFRLPQGDVE